MTPSKSGALLTMNRVLRHVALAGGVLMMAAVSEAATITAASCSRADVGSAVSASTYGDTVVIPSGSCTWTTSLNITKGITLQGAGASSTVITSAVTSTWLLTYKPDATSIANDQPFKLTGVTLDMNFKSGGLWVTQASNTKAMTKLHWRQRVQEHIG